MQRVAKLVLSVGAAVLAVALVLVFVYLAFLPVPADVPTGKSEPGHAHAVECHLRRAARSLTPQTHEVHPGDKVQLAIDRASPGDVVLVHPGSYTESLLIEIDGLTLRGVAERGQRPVLQGFDRHENGIVACGDGLIIEGLELQGYTENGVLVQDASRVILQDLFANSTGEYGLFALRSDRVQILDSLATGASDTGIYVGQSADVTVENNEAFGNVSGFEVENSSRVVVRGNYAHENTAGMLVFLLPDLSSKVGVDNLVENNRVIENNLVNFAPEGEIVSNVPAGSGILIMAADRTEVRGNDIAGNNSFGVAVISLRQLMPDREAFDVGTEPEGNSIHDNSFADNGAEPDPALQDAGLPGADLLWDASGWDNSWSEPTATRFPSLLPGPGWPDFLRRGYWRALNFLADQL